MGFSFIPKRFQPSQILCTTAVNRNFKGNVYEGLPQRIYMMFRLVMFVAAKTELNNRAMFSFWAGHLINEAIWSLILFIHLSVCLSICPFVCLSIHSLIGLCFPSHWKNFVTLFKNSGIVKAEFPPKSYLSVKLTNYKDKNTLILQLPRASTLPQTCLEELGRREVWSGKVPDTALLVEPSINKLSLASIYRYEFSSVKLVL